MIFNQRRHFFCARNFSGFTLVELLAAAVVIAVLSTLVINASKAAYRASSLAVSANNLRQLAAGAMAYLGENNGRFWRYREGVPDAGVRWWFGLEPRESLIKPEGQRWFDPAKGPLGAYAPAGLKPDPSFALVGKPFKPKFRFGYIGIGYNVHLADETGGRGGWSGIATPFRSTLLARPGEIVMFCTSAQVNTFQRPASSSNPMIEEFYGIDEREVTVHGRHNGKAMVAYANGSCGFLDLDPRTLDLRDPKALIGRFAPVGSKQHLWEVQPE